MFFLTLATQPFFWYDLMLVISIKQGLVVAVGHSIFILFPVND